MQYITVYYNITAAGAVDREFLYIQSLPELSQGLPELRQSLPELTQTTTASQCGRSYRPMFCFFFFMDLSAKTPSFQSVSGRQSSMNALKTRCSR